MFRAYLSLGELAVSFFIYFMGGTNESVPAYLESFIKTLIIKVETQIS